MLRRFLQSFWWMLLLGILTILIFLGLKIKSYQTAIAAISRFEQVPGEIIYRSHLKLDDQSGNVW